MKRNIYTVNMVNDLLRSGIAAVDVNLNGLNAERSCFLWRKHQEKHRNFFLHLDARERLISLLLAFCCINHFFHMFKPFPIKSSLYSPAGNDN